MIPSEEKLLKLLKSNDVTFFIPPFQRNYEWEKEQCHIFWEDVVKTVRSNQDGDSAEHFFGTVTYFESPTGFTEPSKLVLIDGQQRITTTMLFLLAIRDCVADEALKAQIDRSYLKNDNVEDGDSNYKIKLKQVETDWESYRKLILGEELSQEEKNSAVYRNYGFFKKWLRESVSESNSLSYSDILELGLDKFSVVTVQLQPEKNKWENPQEIFESMNSLGKPLSLADLVRNYLLLEHDPDEQNRLYNSYWLIIEKRLPGEVSNFIRDYMQMVKQSSVKIASDANTKKLYRDFKIAFGHLSSEEILSQLKDYSLSYQMILGTVEAGDVNTQKQLDNLRFVGSKSPYSFMMAVLQEWLGTQKLSAADVSDIFNAMLVYLLRRRVIGLSGQENKEIPTYVKYLPVLIASDNKKSTMFEILSRQMYATRLPNDGEIKAQLMTANFYNLKYNKLIFALIEEKLTKSMPNMNDAVLQVEHIMPQTLSESWREALGENYAEIHQTYVNTIGNLTLMRHNQEVSNKPFAEKKKIYAQQEGLQISQQKITDCDAWSVKEILARSNWIIDYFLNNVVPIPDDMKETSNYAAKKKTTGRARLSMEKIGIIGETISFVLDPSITAKVVSDTEAEYDGKKYKLSPLTREVQKKRGKASASGAYQGGYYWTYKGVRLTNYMPAEVGTENTVEQDHDLTSPAPSVIPEPQDHDPVYLIGEYSPSTAFSAELVDDPSLRISPSPSAEPMLRLSPRFKLREARYSLAQTPDGDILSRLIADGTIDASTSELIGECVLPASSAASICCGEPRDGMSFWQLDDGRTLGDFLLSAGAHARDIDSTYADANGGTYDEVDGADDDPDTT